MIWFLRKSDDDEDDDDDIENSNGKGEQRAAAATFHSGMDGPRSSDSANKVSGAEDDNTDVLMSLRRDANTFGYDEIEQGDKIGEGSFGNVYKAQLNGQTVAMKTVLQTTVDAVDELISEAKLMARLPPHDNVLLLLGVVDSPHLALLLEYCAGGSLADKLSECATAAARGDDTMPLSEAALMRVLRGTSKGMRHLHQNKIIHRDLAARNVLLRADGVAKVSDFGLSRHLAEDKGKTKSDTGPLKW